MNPSTHRRPKPFLFVAIALSLLVAACSDPTSSPALEREGTTKVTDGVIRSDATFADMTSLNATHLAATLVGAGVTVSNAAYVGAGSAAGTFAFTEADDVIGFPTGVILSTGQIHHVRGPNQSGATTTAHGTPGDPDLDILAGATTFDAAVLTFDFVPNADTVFFRYVFGSEEYPEYVASQYNDVFGFFVNGVNCAVVGDPPVPVTVNTINADVNAELFISNWSFGPGVVNTEMDGFTVVLTCIAPVHSGEVNSLKLAIADTNDQLWDSWVFIEAGSLTTTPPEEPEPGVQGCSPGFWRNAGLASGAWDVTGWEPGALVASAFETPFALLGEATLLQALAFRGGSSAEQAGEILLRAAVAALLNAGHPDVEAAWSTSELVLAVNAALAQGGDSARQWRARMLALAALLDEANNLGCSLSEGGAAMVP